MTGDLFDGGSNKDDADDAAKIESEIDALLSDGVLPDSSAPAQAASFAFRDVADWLEFLASLKTIAASDLIDKAVINAFFKRAEEAVLFAYKVARPDKDKTFNRADIRPALKRLLETRDDAVFVAERIAYFEAQTAWFDANFPGGAWRDVEGLCKIASRAEIEEQNFSLNPGRYVGVAMEDDGMTAEEFRGSMFENGETLRGLHTEADELQRLIAADLSVLFAGAENRENA